MIARLDNPGKPKGEMGVSYSNKGSVARLKNYLIKNEEKYDSTDMFFTATRDNISADEFYKMIDNNVKGLEKNEHKFYSLTFNPSADELQHINNDRDKIKDFVRSAMSDFYKTHKTIKASDELVWAAIIHDNREITEEDLKKEKYKGNTNLKVGDMKPGNNMHVHVVLSARDAMQKKTVSVFTPKNKVSQNFELATFQRNTQRLFQEKFDYQKGIDIYGNRQANDLKNEVKKIDKILYKSYDPNDIIETGKKMDWGTRFSKNQKTMFRETKIEKQIFLHPKIYLEHGRKYYHANMPDGRIAANEYKSSYVLQDNTTAYQTLSKAFENFCHSVESEGKRQATKGYDLVKRPKRKNKKKGFNRGLSF